MVRHRYFASAKITTFLMFAGLAVDGWLEQLNYNPKIFPRPSALYADLAENLEVGYGLCEKLEMDGPSNGI